MGVLRKILGVFLLLFALYVGCAYFMSLPRVLDRLPAGQGPEKQGAVFGTVLFGLMVAALLYFMIRKGLKLLNKTKPADEIDQIGR